MNTRWRDYEYQCPECGKKSSPIDHEGNEILSKMCPRFTRHENGNHVRMKIVQLDMPKRF